MMHAEPPRRPRVEYYSYYRLPMKVVFRGGQLDGEGWRFNGQNGGWRRVDRDVLMDAESNVGGEVDFIGRDSFIDLTEFMRAHYRLGEGDVAALYGEIDAIRERAASEGRPWTRAE